MWWWLEKEYGLCYLVSIGIWGLGDLGIGGHFDRSPVQAREATGQETTGI
jgi:hypothetical protein